MRIADHAGPLAGALESLSDAVDELIQADVPVDEKQAVITQATMLFGTLLEEAKPEELPWALREPSVAVMRTDDALD